MSLENTPAARISALAAAQKTYFRSGATLSEAFRRTMLRRLDAALANWEKRLCDALPDFFCLHVSRFYQTIQFFSTPHFSCHSQANLLQTAHRKIIVQNGISKRLLINPSIFRHTFSCFHRFPVFYKSRPGAGSDADAQNFIRITTVSVPAFSQCKCFNVM